MRPGLLKRTFIVDKKLQSTLFGYTIFVVAVTTVFNSLSFYISDLFDSGSLGSDHRITFAALFIGGAISFALVLLALVFISHQIAGPLHRLKLHMDKVGSGEAPGPIAFRKGDQFSALALKYNSLISRQSLRLNEADRNPNDR